MERLKSLHDLDKNAPDFLLLEVDLLLLVARDLLVQVSVVRVLHNNTA